MGLAVRGHGRQLKHIHSKKLIMVAGSLLSATIKLYMQFLKKYLSLILFLLPGHFILAQVCQDSVQFYGVTANNYKANANTFLKLSNGNSFNIGNDYTGDYNRNAIISLTNKQGQFIRAKKITVPGNKKFALNNVAETPGSGIVSCGLLIDEDERFQHGILLVKFDSLLNIQWSKLFTNAFSVSDFPTYFLSGLHCDDDGNIFFGSLCGDLLARSPLPITFIAVDNDGSILWSKAFDERYFQKHISGLSNFRNNNITSIDDKLLILSQYEDSTSVDFQTIPRPAFLGYSFNKKTGKLNRLNKVFVPYRVPHYGSPFYGGNNPIIRIYPFADKFSYSILESYFDPVNNIQELNIINFVSDTLFNTSRVRKLKGRLAYGGLKPGFWMSSNNSLAFVKSFSPAYSFAVIDSANNILISKNVGNAIVNNPDIQNINFDDNNNSISLKVTDFNTNSGVTQIDIPLHSKTADRSCLGTDTSFFTIDTLSFIKKDVQVDTVYSDIMQAQNFDLLSSDYQMQKQEFCKAKSICSNFSLSGSSVFCTSLPQTFIVKKNPGCLKDIKWENNAIPADIIATTDTSVTLKFNQSWSGYLKAGLYGCELKDSIYIAAYIPGHSIYLGEDTTLCSGKTLSLNAGSGFKNYKWQDGSADSLFVVSQPGLYYLTAEDYCGNVYADTINIKSLNLKLSVGNDISICKSDTITLMASPGFQNYMWSPLYNISSNSGKEISVFPENTTEYFVTAEKFPGCEFKDTVLVTVKDCPQYFYIPSAFSPNNDGKNDLFKPIISGSLKSYEFVIYNRWGQVVFRTKNKSEGWNGNFTGQLQEGGVFVWICRYKFFNQAEQIKKGTFLLIR